MPDWKQYWNNARQLESEDPLRQVGKTVGGEPISEKEFGAIIDDIVRQLRLETSDSLLDLGCGNGMITHRLAAHCASVTGVDFSSPLIEVARRRFAAKNVEYRNLDICALRDARLPSNFNKALVYEAVQHLAPEQLHFVLDGLRDILEERSLVLFGAVPDRERIWCFYDTPERVREYRERSSRDCEMIGYWWTAEELASILETYGFAVQVQQRTGSPHGAHYRFDLLAFRGDRQ